LGSSAHGSNPARLAAAALSLCSYSRRWMADSCLSSLSTSASDGAPGAGRNVAGTGWAGGATRDGRCVRAPGPGAGVELGLGAVIGGEGALALAG
jgi:hypothetical protein